jgi:hypothetical protein
MSPRLAISAAALCAALAGCSGMSDTQQRTLTGGTIGAASGAVIGAMAGSPGWGAAIGAGAGLAGGYLYDRHRKNIDAAYRQGYRDASVPR